MGLSVGFVPTMGALHEGHLKLVKRSKDENDVTVVSIFVNPIQFNNSADLEKYPRTIATDLEKLQLAGCNIVFIPEVDEMYPDGTPEFPELNFGPLGQVMEGSFRPGHFKGVAIVVDRLFSIVNPDRAYFGKKDYQQLAIVQFMVKQLNHKVTIIPCETVREDDGLAMSSRNIRLTRAERDLAPEIYRILKGVKERAGLMDIPHLKNWAMEQFSLNPAFQVEYFEIGDCHSLQPADQKSVTKQGVAFVAVYLGGVRLIDNIELFS